MRLKYSGSMKAIKVINPDQQSKFILWMPVQEGSVIDCPDEAAQRLLVLTDPYGNLLYSATGNPVTVQPQYI